VGDIISDSRATSPGMHEGSNRSRDRGHHRSVARGLLEAGLNEAAPAARGLWRLNPVGCGELPGAALLGMVIGCRHYGRIGRCVASNQPVDPDTAARVGCGRMGRLRADRQRRAGALGPRFCRRLRRKRDDPSGGHELSQVKGRSGIGVRLSTAISTRCPPQAGQISSGRPKRRAKRSR
jgi:hypothetical protein